MVEGGNKKPIRLTKRTLEGFLVYRRGVAEIVVVGVEQDFGRAVRVLSIWVTGFCGERLSDARVSAGGTGRYSATIGLALDDGPG